MKMKKISLLVLLVLLISMIAIGCGGGGSENGGEAGNNAVDEQEVYKIRLGHSQPRETNVSQGLIKLAELAEEKSDGRLQIEIFFDAVIGSDRETHEAAQQGTIEMSSASTANMATFSRDWMVWDLPYITSPENQDKIYAALDNGPLGKYFREDAERIGYKLIMFGEYGYRQMTNNIRPLIHPSDLAGLTLRTTDSPVEIAFAEHHGANPTAIAWGEVYTSLQQGTMDGQGNTFGLLYDSQHHENTKYASTTYHNYSMHILVMNLDYFNNLPADLQDIMLESAQEAVTWQRAISAELEEKAKQGFIDSGVEVTDLTPEQLSVWKEASAPVWDQFVGPGKDLDQSLVDLLLDAQK